MKLCPSVLNIQWPNSHYFFTSCDELVVWISFECMYILSRNTDSDYLYTVMLPQSHCRVMESEKPWHRRTRPFRARHHLLSYESCRDLTKMTIISKQLFLFKFETRANVLSCLKLQPIVTVGQPLSLQDPAGHWMSIHSGHWISMHKKNNLAC